MKKLNLIYKVALLGIGIWLCIILSKISNKDVPRYHMSEGKILDTFTGKVYFLDPSKGIYYEQVPYGKTIDSLPH